MPREPHGQTRSDPKSYGIMLLIDYRGFRRRWVVQVQRFLGEIAGLPDRELLERVKRLHGTSNRVLADLIAHLREVQQRKLFREQAYSSMFQYLTVGLGLDEGAAMMRIRAARVAAAYPFVLELLAEGRLHLTGLSLLAPHLDVDGSGEALVREAIGKSRRAIEALLAERFPKPDVRPSIRKLPRSAVARTEPSSSSPELAPIPGSVPGADNPLQAVQVEPAESSPGTPAAERTSAADRRTGRPSAMERPNTAGGTRSGPSAATARIATHGDLPGAPATARPAGAAEPVPPPTRPVVPPPSPSRAEVAPLGADRFKVQFMASGEQVARLRELQDLLSHQVPTGDLAEIIDRAISLLRDTVLKSKLGAPAGDARKRGAVTVERADDEAAAASQQSPPDVGEGCRQEQDTAGVAVTGSAAAAPPPRELAPAREARAGAAMRLPPRPVAGPEGAASPAGAHEPAIAAGSRTPDSAPAPSRYIRRAVRRAVFERDGFRCTYVDAEGRQCEARRFLQLDHAIPYALGGPSTAENLRLRCAGHNEEEAWRQFGRAFVDDRIDARRRAGETKARAG